MERLKNLLLFFVQTYFWKQNKNSEEIKEKKKSPKKYKKKKSFEKVSKFKEEKTNVHPYFAKTIPSKLPPFFVKCYKKGDKFFLTIDQKRGSIERDRDPETYDSWLEYLVRIGNYQEC